MCFGKRRYFSPNPYPLKPFETIWQQLPAWGTFGLPAFFTAMAVSLALLPFLIFFCSRFSLYDHPGGRKLHSNPKPTMGGLAIFLGSLVAICLFGQPIAQKSILLAGFLLVLVTGITDDRRSLRPLYKLGLQVLASLLAAFAGLRLQSLHGVLGVGAIALPLQYLLTVLFLTLVVNAFNLIDGIDGLAGGLALSSLSILGFMLAFHGDLAWAVIAFALTGGILGFLYFNIQPAKIFMGDTGSLVIGFSVAILCLRVLQIHPEGKGSVPLPLLPVMATVALPVMDLLRLFLARLQNGQSPFTPDCNHLHHLLTRQGLSHRITSIILMGLHYVLVLMGFLLQPMALPLGIFVLATLPLCFTLVAQWQAKVRLGNTTRNVQLRVEPGGTLATSCPVKKESGRLLKPDGLA